MNVELARFSNLRVLNCLYIQLITPGKVVLIAISKRKFTVNITYAFFVSVDD